MVHDVYEEEDVTVIMNCKLYQTEWTLHIHDNYRPLYNQHQSAGQTDSSEAADLRGFTLPELFGHPPQLPDLLQQLECPAI